MSSRWHLVTETPPLPFNPTTEIGFSLPGAADLKLEVYHVTGQKVATQMNPHLEAGHHSLAWDGSDTVSAVYLHRLQAGGVVETKKMVMLIMNEAGTTLASTQTRLITTARRSDEITMGL